MGDIETWQEWQALTEASKSFILLVATTHGQHAMPSDTQTEIILSGFVYRQHIDTWKVTPKFTRMYNKLLGVQLCTQQ